MLRTALSVTALLLLAACASTPSGSGSHASRHTHITVSRAYAPPPGFPHFVDHSIGREEIPIEAMALVGVPYRWGGNTPDSGFDCSGFVRYVVAHAASITLPRTTGEMSKRGESIEPDEIAPGDLVFFDTDGRAHSHVGIYVGKLRFINAPSTGGTVRLDYLSNPYWAAHFDGIRRVVQPIGVPQPIDAPVATMPVYAKQETPGRSVDAPVAQVSEQPVVASYASTERSAPVVAYAPPAEASVASRPPVQHPVATANADAYEPPPGYTPPQTAAAPQVPMQNTYAPPSAPAVSGNAPDAIDAAADAFEPPPANATAAAQQAQYVESGNVGAAVRAANSSDPIASFAGNN